MSEEEIKKVPLVVAPTPPTHTSDIPKPQAVGHQSPQAVVEQRPMKSSKKVSTTIVLALIIVLAGVGSGYALSEFFPMGNKPLSNVQAPPTEKGAVTAGEVYGSQDKSAFKDEAEGVLLKGGIEGEGSHRILRPGGVDQTVYLTSSVVDLDVFDGHKVKVWGETFAAQKAGWLLDVGRVEVIELNAEKPFEEE